MEISLLLLGLKLRYCSITPLVGVFFEMENMGKIPKTGIVCDGSYRWSADKLQYQVLDLSTGELLYVSKVYEGGSSNVAEFLGIVHSAAHCMNNGIKDTIYTDSYIGIKWVKSKNCWTKEWLSDELDSVVKRAVSWLKSNTIQNKIVYWDKSKWGENPADFGRK